MRQIWEKETKLTKEEVHERLEKYFTDNKYINTTDEMGVLLCNASMKNRYFQIFYKEGIIRIEGWVKKGKNEQTTSDKKKDILGTDMQAFPECFLMMEEQNEALKKKTAIMQDMKCNYIWACQKSSQGWHG